jgi:hypothetical protein
MIYGMIKPCDAVPSGHPDHGDYCGAGTRYSIWRRLADCHGSEQKAPISSCVSTVRCGLASAVVPRQVGWRVWAGHHGFGLVTARGMTNGMTAHRLMRAIESPGGGSTVHRTAFLG